jgi:23S rRNA (cytosine1962-C5)-methyltransferase
VLESLFHPAAIIERNDSGLRVLEGLPEQQGCVRGTDHSVTFSEYGIKYVIDLLEGQKTGFFLDQRENRKAIRRYAKNSRLLDCFCNNGGFALNAAYAEATEITAVDSSQAAITNAVANAKLNSLSDRISFVTADAFEFLKKCVEKGQRFDVINLDPPSFTKSKKNVAQAKRGYKDLHELAFRCLEPGGILATASCSHHIFDEIFLEIVNDSARATGREINLLEWRGAAPDHPTLPAMPETAYLKFAIFKAE